MATETQIQELTAALSNLSTNVALSDAINSTSSVSDGVAATPLAVKTAKEEAITAAGEALEAFATDIEVRINSIKEDWYSPSLFTATKTSVTLPAGMLIKIDDVLYTSTVTNTLNVSDAGGTVVGKDVYIYACAPTSGTEPVFEVSLNSTVPTGYTATNSRKIGGFHCLCEAVGTISGHPLSGYAAGNILPASRWDLTHRPVSDPEGMFYNTELDLWCDIYLASWNGIKLVSVYGGTTADGASSKSWHGEAFCEQYSRYQNKRLPWRREFQVLAKGSNEETNIFNSADADTTGGHVDTASRRMISNDGGEDMCGFLWQWLEDLGFAGGSDWTESVYDSSVDPQGYGQTYGTLFRLLGGGRWADGVWCGSRSARCSDNSAFIYAHGGGRGVSEPKVTRAYR